MSILCLCVRCAALHWDSTGKNASNIHLKRSVSVTGENPSITINAALLSPSAAVNIKKKQSTLLFQFSIGCHSINPHELKTQAQKNTHNKS